MKCNDVLEHLDRFIEKDLPDEQYNEIEKHLDSCEECRAMYESEKEINEILNASFNDEEIQFESRISQVMDEIDVDRYSKKEDNVVDINQVKKRKHFWANKRFLGVAAAFAFIVCISPTMISQLKDKSDMSADKFMVADDMARDTRNIENKAEKAESFSKDAVSGDMDINPLTIAGELQGEAFDDEAKIEPGSRSAINSITVGEDEENIKSDKKDKMKSAPASDGGQSVKSLPSVQKNDAQSFSSKNEEDYGDGDSKEIHKATRSNSEEDDGHSLEEKVAMTSLDPEEILAKQEKLLKLAINSGDRYNDISVKEFIYREDIVYAFVQGELKASNQETKDIIEVDLRTKEVRVFKEGLSGAEIKEFKLVEGKLYVEAKYGDGIKKFQFDLE